MTYLVWLACFAVGFWLGRASRTKPKTTAHSDFGGDADHFA